MITKNRSLLVMTALSTALLTAACSQNSLEKSGASPAAFAQLATADGQDRGNGTDVELATDAAAWFVGADKTFTYCVEVDPAFGMSRGEVLKAIDDSFKDWATYHLERSYYKKLSTKSELQNSCSNNTDVEFKIGGKIPSGDRNNRHVGVAVKTSYDLKAAWGRGYVWLANQNSIPTDEGYGMLPNWTSKSLKAILLHEIGHVYGVAHVDGTIMEKGAGAWAMGRAATNRPDPKIDGSNILLPPTNGISGVLGLSAEQEPDLKNVPFGSSQANFEMLMGRSPVGIIHAALKLSANLDRAQLTVYDDEGSETFDLKGYPWERTSPIHGGQSAFLTRVESGDSSMFYSDPSSSGVRELSLQTKNGRLYPVNVYYNSPTGFEFVGVNGKGQYETMGVTLKVATSDGPRYLFTTHVKQWGFSRPTTP